MKLIGLSSLFSILIHIMAIYFVQLENTPKTFKIKQTPLKLVNLRTIGDEQSKKKFFTLNKKKTNSPKKKVRLSDLRQTIDTPYKPVANPRSSKNILLKRNQKNLKLTKKNIDHFLKTQDPNQNPPSQALKKALSLSDIDVSLELPKGVKESELNKRELVFYSFQRRTALTYINSFQKQLNEFDKQNPHLVFPLTKHKQKLAGKVIYDKNGDILKIEILKTSKVTKLQSFFLNVLQEMSSLPNPPKEIIDNDQFAVNFILSIN